MKVEEYVWMAILRLPSQRYLTDGVQCKKIMQDNILV